MFQNGIELVGKPIGTHESFPVENNDALRLMRAVLRLPLVDKHSSIDDTATRIRTTRHTRFPRFFEDGDGNMPVMRIFGQYASDAAFDAWHARLAIYRFRPETDLKIANIYEVRVIGGDIQYAARKVRILRNIVTYSLKDVIREDEETDEIIVGEEIEEHIQRVRRGFDMPLTGEHLDRVEEQLERLEARQRAQAGLPPDQLFI